MITYRCLKIVAQLFPSISVPRFNVLAIEQTFLNTLYYVSVESDLPVVPSSLLVHLGVRPKAVLAADRRAAASTLGKRKSNLPN